MKDKIHAAFKCKKIREKDEKKRNWMQFNQTTFNCSTTKTTLM